MAEEKKTIPIFLEQAKSANVVAVQNQFADVTQEEISTYLGGQHDDADSDSDEEDGTPTKGEFVVKFLKALIPTPTNLADVMSSKTEEVEDYTVTETALAASGLDRISAARTMGRRASATANRCVVAHCRNAHFRTDSVFCHEHDEDYTQSPAKLRSANDVVKNRRSIYDRNSQRMTMPAGGPSQSFASETSTATTASTVPEPKTDALTTHYLQRAELRREMYRMTETFNYPISREILQSARAQWEYYVDCCLGVKDAKQNIVRSSSSFFGGSFVDKKGSRQKGPIKAKNITVNSFSNSKGSNKTPKKLSWYSKTDFELAQLLEQFKRLNVANNGVLCVDDLVHLIETYVDKEWVTSTPRVDVEAKVGEWLGSAVDTVLKSTGLDYDILSDTPDGAPLPAATAAGASPTMTFPIYVHALLLLRQAELDTDVLELLRTGFWDLRLCILFMPGLPKEGWLLKRGYMLPVETMNAWRRRWFRVLDHTLEYYDGVPEDDHLDWDDASVHPNSDNPRSPGAECTSGKTAILKGTINLRDIVAVNFSPKTTVPRQRDLVNAGVRNLTQVCFKVTVGSGRRYTLSAERNDAIAWAAYLTWYANASRCINEWCEMWGTKRKTSVSIRDFINASSVIVKIGMGKSLLAEWEKTMEEEKGKAETEKNKAAKKEFKAKMAELAITDRDHFHLTVVGLNENDAEDAGGVILSIIRSWKYSKGFIADTDKKLTGGYVLPAVGGVVNGVIGSVMVYNYCAHVENRLRQNKYGVVWMSKKEERNCYVCLKVFKSVSMRTTMSKHHCRSCGRIVCHACSSHSIWMDISQSFERTCNYCVENNGPPKDCIIRFSGPEEARNQLSANATAVGKKHLQAAKSMAVDGATDAVKGAASDAVSNAKDAVSSKLGTGDSA